MTGTLCSAICERVQYPGSKSSRTQDICAPSELMDLPEPSKSHICRNGKAYAPLFIFRMFNGYPSSSAAYAGCLISVPTSTRLTRTCLSIRLWRHSLHNVLVCALPVDGMVSNWRCGLFL